MAEEKRSFVEEETQKLRLQVLDLEEKNRCAIVDLQEMMASLSVEEMDDPWLTRLDSIEIFTMEEAPPLAHSIRMICSGVA